MYGVRSVAVVPKRGSSFPSREAVGSISASRCLYHTEEGHASMGHGVHVKPVLEVSWFCFPTVLMTRLNVTFPFWQILKIDTIKAQLLWSLTAGIYAFSRKIEKKKNLHDICLFLFLINWHDRVEKKSNSQTISYRFKYRASRWSWKSVTSSQLIFLYYLTYSQTEA